MKNVATSRSSPSSEPPAWLRDVYDRRRRRTVRLVELSIATLERMSEKPSLAAIARVSKTVDPAEPQGVSESPILHNIDAYAVYRQHSDRKRQTVRHALAKPRVGNGGNNRIRVNADRDCGRARQRYLRATKAELVDRLLAGEQAYADMEARWLRTADDLLVWIVVLDRLLTGPGFS